MIMLRSPRIQSTTRSSWKTPQRMCQSFVFRRRTLTLLPLPVVWVIASLPATRRISFLSIQKQVRQTCDVNDQNIAVTAAVPCGVLADRKQCNTTNYRIDLWVSCLLSSSSASSARFWHPYNKFKRLLSLQLDPKPRRLKKKNHCSYICILHPVFF